MKAKRLLYALALSVILFLSWVALARVYQYLIPYRWLETLLIFVTLPFLLWIAMLASDQIQKRIDNK